MAALFKRFNSKGFLLLYLVVFASLLMGWLFRTDQARYDHREIPESLRPVLVSPVTELPQFVLYGPDKQVFTEQSLLGKWSFIYFTHPRCLPQCEPVLSVMHNLKQLFASRDMQFLLINFDSRQLSAEMGKVFADREMRFPLYSGEKKMLTTVIEAFDFLYLRTELEQGYSLEQQHSLFLTAPKGRLYARFEPPFTSLAIQQSFFELRDFYARSE